MPGLPAHHVGALEGVVGQGGPKHEGAEAVGHHRGRLVLGLAQVADEHGQGAPAAVGSVVANQLGQGSIGQVAGVVKPFHKWTAVESAAS